MKYFDGATVVVNSSCKGGHKHRFCSSHEVNGIYANNLPSAAAVLLSGNNFAKVSTMADFYILHSLECSGYIHPLGKKGVEMPHP